MWTVIYYKEALENSTLVRIYDDSTEKAFEDQENANEYAAYLHAKYVSQNGGNVDIYEKFVYLKDELSITNLKKLDALNKLTQEEKDLLGVS